ncbi:hypothetical protein HRbin24_01599 [bacterium HR24]|nr:hypothetical protein HRbin24_01599 [bacterium HR24]
MSGVGRQPSGGRFVPAIVGSKRIWLAGLAVIVAAFSPVLPVPGLGDAREVGAQGGALLTWVERGWTAYSVSDDGGRLFFAREPLDQGHLWQRGAGIWPLGELPGYQTSAYGASADGGVVAGAAVPPGSTETQPAIWRTGTGWQLLPQPAGANASYPLATSADGRFLAGIGGAVSGTRILWAKPALWVDGNPRIVDLPAEWAHCFEGRFRAASPAGDAAVGTLGPAGCPIVAMLWTPAGGLQVLGTAFGYEASQAYGVSDGGSVVVGDLMRRLPGGYWDTAAFRWTPLGGMERLPDMGGRSSARAVSADGRIIGGSVVVGGMQRAAIWRDGVLHNLHDELSRELGLGEVLVEVTAVSRNGRFVAGMGGRGLERFVFVAEVPQPPEAPQLVAIWPIEGERERAMISWAPPSGVTHYRLQSALDPGFTFGVSTLEFPAGPYNLLPVGAPMWDGGVFYYRIAACSERGCSPWSYPLVLARRVWPGPEHWNMVAGGFAFLGTAYVWAQNASPVAGKASDLHLYEGLQGFGGVVRRSCRQVAPGGICRADFQASSGFLSASQSFPPYGEVGVGFVVR